MAGLARAAGVPKGVILLEDRSGSTLESARLSAAMMRARGWRRAVVVSDRVHVPRGLLSFLGTGVRARGVGLARAWRDGPFSSPWRYLAYEVAGCLWYAVLLAVGRRTRYTGLRRGNRGRRR